MKRVVRIIFGMFLVAVAPYSCMQEDLPHYEGPGADEVELHFQARSLVFCSPWTKATYGFEVDDAGITSAAIGVYDSFGNLVHSQTVAGPFTGFPAALRLHKEQRYSCYAVTGYIAEHIVFPSREADLDNLVIENISTNSSGQYDLSSTLGTYGLDRAGKIQGLTPAQMDAFDGAADGVVSVPVQSLWAKVALSVDMSYLEDLDIDSSSLRAQVCGAGWGNRTFAPFKEGGNRTIDPEKLALLPKVAINSPAPGTTSPIVFYVPENMFGTLLPGNDNSDDKTPGNVALAYSQETALAVERSAVELTNPVVTAWGESGSLTYRFCLGSDELCNFDIKRNTLYSVALQATSDGYKIKSWKAESDINDSRILSLSTLAPQVVHGGWMRDIVEFPTGDFANIEGSSDFYLVPDYNLGSEDLTYGKFNDAAGWRMSAHSARLLQTLGVSYSIEKKYVYASMFLGEASLHIEDNLPESLAERLFFYDGTYTKTDLLHFTPSATLAGGTAFPITIETFDGEHSATVTLQAQSDGSLQVYWAKEASYVGQIAELRAKDFSGSVTSVSYSLDDSYSTLAGIASTTQDGACRLALTGSGEIEIKYEGLNSLGSPVCSGSVSLVVKKPVLHCATTICELSPDGTGALLSSYYTTTSGAAMTIAASDADGYGTSFAPSLYTSLLQSSVSTCEEALKPYLGSSGMQVYVQRLFDGETSLEPLLGQVFGDGIKISPAAQAAADPVYCSVKIKSPVTPCGEDRKIGTIDNNILSGRSMVHPGAVSLGAGETVTVSAEKFSYGAALSNLWISPTSDIEYSLEADGCLKATGRANPSGTGAGKVPLTVNCRNTRSGETLRMGCGFVEVYLHTAPVAILDLTQMHPAVKTDIAGADLSPAISSLRTLMTEAPGGCVWCSFSRGAFYSLGYGRWNYQDEFDSEGNQYTAPQQQYLLTEFQEADWQAPVRIGEIAYYVIVGKFELDEGKYDSVQSFLDSNEKAHVYFDFSATQGLRRSPANAAMFHYDYGDDTDDDGFSYYIIDQVSSADWKKF